MEAETTLESNNIAQKWCIKVEPLLLFSITIFYTNRISKLQEFLTVFLGRVEEKKRGERMRKMKVLLPAMVFAIALYVSTVPAKAIVYEPPWEATANLMAGQDINAGLVLIRDNFQYLTIKFRAKPDWRITETHLAIATSLNGIPQTKKGNPIPGQFQYKNDTLDSVESFQYMIPMTWANGTTLYIAAHCVVEGVSEFCGQTESAWAGNFPFPGSNWANYTIYITDYIRPPRL